MVTGQLSRATHKRGGIGAGRQDIRFPFEIDIFRVFRDVGLIPQKCTDQAAHEILTQIVPPGKFYSFHVNLIRLGRTICRPREPQCERCPIVEYCDYGSTRL